jgi:hypothetical protein
MNSRLMAFDLDNVELCLYHYVAFQVIIAIRNLDINMCIVDEGDSSCVISLLV